MQGVGEAAGKAPRTLYDGQRLQTRNLGITGVTRGSPSAPATCTGLFLLPGGWGLTRDVGILQAGGHLPLVDLQLQGVHLINVPRDSVEQGGVSLGRTLCTLTAVPLPSAGLPQADAFISRSSKAQTHRPRLPLLSPWGLGR